MGFVSVLSMAHQLVQQRVRQGETVIDATAGNGNDTLFLARLVGPSGSVLAFDIQREALEATRRKLAEAGIPAALSEGNSAANIVELGAEAETAKSGQGVRLVLDSHAEMPRYTEGFGAAAAVMFNLGYLPGANSGVITQPSSSLAALEAALSLLRPGGVLTAVVYPGHPGGKEEADAVEAWAEALPQRIAQTLVYRFANRRLTSPYLIAVEKLGASAIIESS